MPPVKQHRVKCLVWDLDQTLWAGVLLEGDRAVLRPGVRTAIEELDRCGILHSIASQGDYELAFAALKKVGLQEYFLAPQIDLLREKPEKIVAIAETLNIQLEHLAFIDDSVHQRALVRHALPEVTVLDANQAGKLPILPFFDSSPSTPESRNRRRLYRTELQRQAAQKNWAGTRLDFLKSCHMQVTLRIAQEHDVERIHELLGRTHRFNASSQPYSKQALEDVVRSETYLVAVAQLSDRFGEQGLVGAMVLDQQPGRWAIETLLVSCRVLGRGVGEILLVYAMTVAKKHRQRHLQVCYQATAQNRQMSLLFGTHGFQPDPKKGNLLSFHHSLDEIPAYPTWVSVRAL